MSGVTIFITALKALPPQQQGAIAQSRARHRQRRSISRDSRNRYEGATFSAVNGPGVRARDNQERRTAGASGGRVWISGYYRLLPRGNRVWVRGHYQEQTR